MSEAINSDVSAWQHWQSEVVVLLQRDYGQELRDVTLQDIDWLTWEPFFRQGKSPRQAIERALERDL